MFTRIYFLLLLLSVFSHIPHYNKQQIAAKLAETKLMYGSTVRIKGIASSHHIHSHDVRYPRGSGQQSVTGMSADNDYNSLWTIKQAHGQPIKTYDIAVKCGDTIRLEHGLTKRNLHSQQIYNSMITQGQQVSAFGNNGYGNDNDNWILSCQNRKNEQDFYVGDSFDLIHENTRKRLKLSRFYKYTFSNWQNCPCQNQLQVSATSTASKQTLFQIVGGIFLKQNPKKQSINGNENSEL